MGKVTVVHRFKEPNHIYCGRGSPVGNPYPLQAESDRDLVCDMYEFWFRKKMSEKENKVIEFMNWLLIKAFNGDINLGCFCAPKRCHCDTIKKYIDKKLKENKNETCKTRL